jgi:hypothetical protein
VRALKPGGDVVLVLEDDSAAAADCFGELKEHVEMTNVTRIDVADQPLGRRLSRLLAAVPVPGPELDLDRLLGAVGARLRPVWVVSAHKEILPGFNS